MLKLSNSGTFPRIKNKPPERLGGLYDIDIQLLILVRHLGLEPRTNGLRVRCSTN